MVNGMDTYGQELGTVGDQRRGTDVKPENLLRNIYVIISYIRKLKLENKIGHIKRPLSRFNNELSIEKEK